MPKHTQNGCSLIPGSAGQALHPLQQAFARLGRTGRRTDTTWWSRCGRRRGFAGAKAQRQLRSSSGRLAGSRRWRHIRRSAGNRRLRRLILDGPRRRRQAIRIDIVYLGRQVSRAESVSSFRVGGLWLW